MNNNCVQKVYASVNKKKGIRDTETTRENYARSGGR